MRPDDGGPAQAGAPVASVRTRSVIDAAKLLSSKGRRERRLFIADGPQAVSEGLSTGLARQVFIAESAIDRMQPLVRQAVDDGVSVIVCDEPALAKVSGAQNPQGIVAVVAIPDSEFAPVTGLTNLIIGLDRVADPGNLGTIIRTAAAAGVDAVALSADCVDPYNDKSVRSSTGSVFHIPVIEDLNLLDFTMRCRSAGMTVLAADAAGERLDSPAIESVLREPTLWLFGSEAHGLAPQLRAVAHHTVAVPHYGKAESLNVASAAAVCLYASAIAQHRTNGTPDPDAGGR